MLGNFLSFEFIFVYLKNEQLLSAIVLLLSITSIIVALFLLFIIKYKLHIGIAYSFIAFSTFQLILTIPYYQFLSHQINSQMTDYLNKEIMINNEIIRASHLINQLIILEYTTLFLVFISVLIVFFKRKIQPFWKGIVYGLLIQCLIFGTGIATSHVNTYSYKQVLLGIKT